MPIFLKKLSNMGSGIFLVVPEKILSQRLYQCSRCEFALQTLVGPVCGKCGCIMNVKAQVGASKCPLNKWPPP
jgi:hypothetical protein